MKNRVDVLSLLVGVVLGAGLLLATGASGPSSTVGRYQIAAFATGPAAGCFLVDTATGELWQAVPEPNGSRKWVRAAGPLADSR